MSAIRQARRMVRQSRNHNSYAIAQQTQIYVSAHLKEGAEPPKVWEFLPHPAEWQHFSANKQLSVSRTVAMDILMHWELLDYDIKNQLEPYLSEIENTLQG